jgi:hypothetical protein
MRNKQKFERWQRVNGEIDQVHKIVEQIAEAKVPKAITGLLRLYVRARYTNILGVCVYRNDYIRIPAGLQKDIADTILRYYDKLKKEKKELEGNDE